MEDTEKDKEALKQTISQLEDTKQQQERALEKLNKDVRRMDHFYTCANEKSLYLVLSAHWRIHSTIHSVFVLSCLPPSFCQYDSLNASLREETQALRVQLEEQKERARKEVQEVQRHENDAHSELEKSQMNIRKLEEEVCACGLRTCVFNLLTDFLFFSIVFMYRQVTKKKKTV